MTVIFCISILLMLIGFIYMLSKDKMASVVGDQNDIDIDKNKKNKKQSNTKKIKNKINKLDKTYSSNKTSSDFKYEFEDNYTKDEDNLTTDNNGNDDVQQDVIVDLDMLYKESQQASSESITNNDISSSNYDDLADLMSSFITNSMPEETEEETFDEKLYDRVISSTNISFSDEDIQKISNLIQMEISQETLDDLEKYKNTPVQKHATKDEILADILATYSIKQNITFSEDDVNAIKQIMNVELSPEFTKDFSTNPIRTKAVEKEILESIGKKPHRTSEILTLSVKDMLPDLSQELKKQHGKNIKSEVKPTVVYYSEGYEYDKLKVSEDFLNISKNLTQNEYKPSYQAPIVESGYDYSTLAIKDELPDLADAKANPEKYQEKPAQIAVDEKALLKSIANVTFKPFYDEKTANEVDKFDNNDFADKGLNNSTSIQQKTKNESKNFDNAEKLLKLIEEQKNERAIREQSAEEAEFFRRELEEASSKNKSPKKIKNKTLETYKYNGENVELLSTAKCTKNSTCKIIHTNNKYIVLGCINDKDIVLKEYNSLKNCEIFVRRNSKDDKSTFLVKIGFNKFIIRITEDNMEFVMNLC